MKHADREARRRASKKEKVTDHGSQSLERCDLLLDDEILEVKAGQQSVEAEPELFQPEIADSEVVLAATVSCHICGACCRRQSAYAAFLPFSSSFGTISCSFIARSLAAPMSLLAAPSRSHSNLPNIKIRSSKCFDSAIFSCCEMPFMCT